MDEFELAGAKQLAFKTAADIRRVFALSDDDSLLDEFAKANMAMQARILKTLSSEGRRRISGIWLPTLIRGCKVVRVVESQPIQQRNFSFAQARSFARKCSVGGITSDQRYVMRQHADVPELLVKTTDSEGLVLPFTPWAIVGCVRPLPKTASELRVERSQSRPSAIDQNNAWAGKHKMQLICQKGNASLFAGVTPIASAVPVEFLENGEENLSAGL
ncbi:hypothetical protein [Paraburkholderia sediminicola]|uniref:hypothetical protein n=1 Tax=Paraburkholderia sediminicola TaxID=458836 RepID=UPI0038B88C21